MVGSTNDHYLSSRCCSPSLNVQAGKLLPLPVWSGRGGLLRGAGFAGWEDDAIHASPARSLRSKLQSLKQCIVPLSVCAIMSSMSPESLLLEQEVYVHANDQCMDVCMCSTSKSQVRSR